MRTDGFLHIDLKALTEEFTDFVYELNDEWFESLGDDVMVRKGNLKCNLHIRKSATHFELSFHTEGSVQIPCDRCLELMDQPILSDDKLIVKFGEGYSEEDDLITVDENEGMLDANWFVYEFIVLCIPIQHVHDNGKCDADMIRLLEEYATNRSGGGDGEEAIDPRWSKLAELNLEH